MVFTNHHHRRPPRRGRSHMPSTPLRGHTIDAPRFAKCLLSMRRSVQAGASSGDLGSATGRGVDQPDRRNRSVSSHFHWCQNATGPIAVTSRLPRPSHDTSRSHTRARPYRRPPTFAGTDPRDLQSLHARDVASTVIDDLRGARLRGRGIFVPLPTPYLLPACPPSSPSARPNLRRRCHGRSATSDRTGRV